MLKDLNFFAPYLGKSQERKNIHRAGYIAVGSLTFVILITLTFNGIRVLKLKSEISDLNEKLSSKTVKAKLAESEEIDKKLDILGKYNEGINQVTNEIATRDIITTELLNRISSTLPSDVAFRNINISEGNLSISATSQSRQAIAEIQHNLKSLPIIGDVYISSISGTGENGERFSFDLKCELKEVN